MIYLIIILVLYMLFDVNYVLRTFFTMLTGGLQRFYYLNEVTTIYGWCTFQNCDLSLRKSRLARIVRDLDFARFNFYERTGVYRRSLYLKIKSLQGSTLTLISDPIPLFAFYKINTKLVYWDEVSLFHEHEVITLHDGKVRYFIVSRQHAIGEDGDSAKALLIGLPGYECYEPAPACPEYIRSWLNSMKISSCKLKNGL